MTGLHKTGFASVTLLLSTYALEFTYGQETGEPSRSADPPPLLQSLPVTRRGQLDAIRQTRPELFESVEPYLELDKTVKAPTPRQVHIIDYWSKPLDARLLDRSLREVVARYLGVYSDLKNAAEQWLANVDACALDESCFQKVDAEHRRKLFEVENACGCSREEFQALVAAAGPHKIRGGPDLDVEFLPAWEAGLLRADVTWGVKQRLYEIVLGFGDRETLPTIVAVRRMASKEGVDQLASSIVHRALLDKPSLASMLDLADIVQREDGLSNQTYRVSIGVRMSLSDEWKALLDRYEADSRTVEAVRSLRDVIRIHGSRKDSP